MDKNYTSSFEFVAKGVVGSKLAWTPSAATFPGWGIPHSGTQRPAGLEVHASMDPTYVVLAPLYLENNENNENNH